MESDLAVLVVAINTIFNVFINFRLGRGTKDTGVQLNRPILPVNHDSQNAKVVKCKYGGT